MCEGILRGPCTDTPRASASKDAPRPGAGVSGVAMPWALRAQQLLGEEWGVDADVWSVTSWNELRRDARDAARRPTCWIPSDAPRECRSWPARLADSSGPVVAWWSDSACAPCLIRFPGGAPGSHRAGHRTVSGFADTRGRSAAPSSTSMPNRDSPLLRAVPLKRGERSSRRHRARAIDRYKLPRRWPLPVPAPSVAWRRPDVARRVVPTAASHVLASRLKFSPGQPKTLS